MNVRCRGVRGATTCAENTREAILEATHELLTLLIEANGIEPEDIASAIFTTTPDLNAEFPRWRRGRLGGSTPPCSAATKWPCRAAFRAVFAS